MDDDRVLIELRKIANLLALGEIANTTKGKAARSLAKCGFSNAEIAVLLDTSEGSIRALLSQARKRPDDAT